jgi:OPA family glycerol-3-phosphate transporter-like MFS transporter
MRVYKQKALSCLHLLSLQITTFLLFLLSPLSAFAADGIKEKAWYTGFTPIAILLAVIAIALWRLPKVKEEFLGQLAHLETPKYRFRRALNWLIVGLMYAFLYWGRYNLNDALRAMGGPDMLANFNWIFSAGTITYGISFLINGPLTDKIGGRFSIILGVLGASAMNIAMGVACWLTLNKTISADQLFWILIILYPMNMYFQSFGAVAIVKVNSAWFHVRERGVFGATFGILIALGLYFAFDFTSLILNDLKLAVPWAFFIPAIALGMMFILGLFLVRNRPSDAGFSDILTGDATSGDTSKPDDPLVVFKMLLRNKIVMTISCIEFCSGFLRQAIMQMYKPFAKAVGENSSFVYQNWGLMLCCAGILGGMFAGVISDRLCHSRRGPVAAILYVGMFLGSIGMCFLLGSPMLAWLIVFMSLCIIGVHGMLSGTASQDFGGSKNAGIATGLIDGFVYLGTGLQAMLYGWTLPDITNVSAKDPTNWWFWPLAMIPVAIIGLILSYRIRNAKPGTTSVH